MHPARTHVHHMAPSQSRWRISLLVLGWALVVLSPIAGLLPGPGGIFLFAGGFALLLRNSVWVRRHYARMKRRHPRLGGYADRALRRPTERRKRIARALHPGGPD